MYKKFFKRFIDIVLSLLATPFVLLVIAIMAPFIFFEDKGPIFYNATRRGRNGKNFKMFKLRSMYVNAPDLKNPDGSTFNSDKDPRVTKIGRFMRKTSVDELPQILNVLIGDMSFIGPRPTLALTPTRNYRNCAKSACRFAPVSLATPRHTTATPSPRTKSSSMTATMWTMSVSFWISRSFSKPYSPC